MSTPQVPKRQLGANGPHVSAIGFGSMGIGAFYGKTNLEEAIKALDYAADCGMTFWDCSDIYGNTESVLGDWFTKTGRRSEIFLATKFGARDPETGKGPVSNPSYIRKSVQRSLTALKTDYIDLYYQHRVDPNVPIEVVVETLKEFTDKGTIKWIGLSECSSETLRRAKAVKGVGDKVIAAQMEFSPYSLEIERLGFAKTAKELGVTVVAYSPLGRGMVSGRYRSRADFEEGDFRLMSPRFSEENFPKNLKITDELITLAKKYNTSSSVVTLAWILAEHSDIIPIPGCRTAERVAENAKGAELQLDPQDIKTIRALVEAADTGERYPPAFLATCMADCIPLSEWKGE